MDLSPEDNSLLVVANSRVTRGVDIALAKGVVFPLIEVGFPPPLRS